VTAKILLRMGLAECGRAGRNCGRTGGRGLGCSGWASAARCRASVWGREWGWGPMGRACRLGGGLLAGPAEGWGWPVRCAVFIMLM
jgi:hypothetical protein